MGEESTLPALARVLAFVALVIAGVVVVFASQAASADDLALWRTTLPFALAHGVGTVAHGRRDRDWSGGVVRTVGIIAAFSFLELSLRVWT